MHPAYASISQSLTRTLHAIDDATDAHEDQPDILAVLVLARQSILTYKRHLATASAMLALTEKGDPTT